MKDGRTHLAHKAEHAVDLDTGAVVAVTLQPADRGDTTTLDETLCEAGEQVAEQIGREVELRPRNKPKVHLGGIEELVTDKGYHSGAVVQRVKSYAVRSYIPEKKQKGRRHWQGKRAEQQAVYQNRRRVRGEYGKSLLRRRGERTGKNRQDSSTPTPSARQDGQWSVCQNSLFRNVSGRLRAANQHSAQLQRSVPCHSFSSGLRLDHVLGFVPLDN